MGRYLLISLLILFSEFSFTQSIDTIQVNTGWNLIGSLYEGSVSNVITTIPSGIIVSSFFGFSPGEGYVGTENLEKGWGYWIKVSQNGLIIWGSAGSVQPCPGIPTVSYGGKLYNTVQIGAQCWLKENLDIGTMIQGTQLPSDNGVIEKYCYNNDPANCNAYGGFYSWNESMQYSITPGVQGICPPGWHVPTIVEYEVLSLTVYHNGNSLKSAGQGTGGGAGTNTSGFSALLAGRRYSNGTFGSSGSMGVFWTSSELNGFYSIYMHLYNTGVNIGLTDLSKAYGYSIRCIKN